MIMASPQETLSQIYGLYDDHRAPHQHPTVAQLTLALVWLIATLYYGISRIYSIFTPVATNTQISENRNALISKEESQDCLIIGKEKEKDEGPKRTQVIVKIDKEELSGTNKNVPDQGTKQKLTDGADKKIYSKVPPPPDFNQVMQHVMVFGLILLYFYLTDYVKIFPKMKRIYERDTFLFLTFLLFLIGSAFTIKPTTDKILNRDQTEEWKGWMQVMFVWYHYFAAKEWYNWIRVYIAAYVWMTGFGNFSFFWVRKDFSPWRVAKMLFRLNFLVICVCVSVKNEYMLYYICAMHTYWFLSVYAFMAIFPSWNYHRYKMMAKFVVYAVCNAILFEIPGLHMALFRPFRFVFGFVDGHHDVMHEWAFRSGLDHWVCFIGMLCAYNYPYFEALIKYLESPSADAKNKFYKLGVKLIIVTVIVCLAVWWYTAIMVKDKYPYNAVHPYTSWIPIIVFIVIRNIHPVLRTHYIHMFAWLGKITLETYLSQLHIYLQSNAKDLIGYLSPYPLLNFSLATIIYLLMSQKLFDLTTHFSAWLLPNNYKEIARKCGLVGVTFTVATVFAYIIKNVCIRQI